MAQKLPKDGSSYFAFVYFTRREDAELAYQQCRDSREFLDAGMKVSTWVDLLKRLHTKPDVT